MTRTFTPDVSRYAAVIFDMDGVVIDSEPLHEEANQSVFKRYGFDLPRPLLMEIKGMVGLPAIDYLIRACRADGRLDGQAVLDEIRQAGEALMVDVEPVTGALAFIRQVRRRVPKVGLTTSARRAAQQLVFGKFDLQPYFDAVVAAEDVQRSKPDPQPYLYTAARLGVEPTACLVIEDSVNGVRSAVGAGCAVAGLTTSFGAAALTEAGAHLTVDGFEALARRLGMENLQQTHGCD
jgi:HAD superfamily hydrolase (TIGR01509 family)